MKENFKSLPNALRKLILLRTALGILGILSFLLILSCSHRWEILFFCGVVICTIAFYIWKLFSCCIRRKYVTVQGICTEITCTRVRKRIQSVTIKDTDRSIKIKIMETQLPVRQIKTGESVTAYFAENVPVYDSDEYKIICSCMALVKEDF